MKILLLNGPNLNLLGKREPEIYGTLTFEAYFETLKKQFPEIELEYYQSNHEGFLIDKLHEVGFTLDGIVFNPGGYSHTSIALHDAIKSITTPVIEVHISDISIREDFRKVSYTGLAAQQTIMGKGLEGYSLAIKMFV